MEEMAFTGAQGEKGLVNQMTGTGSTHVRVTDATEDIAGMDAKEMADLLTDGIADVIDRTMTIFPHNYNLEIAMYMSVEHARIFNATQMPGIKATVWEWVEMQNLWTKMTARQGMERRPMLKVLPEAKGKSAQGIGQ